MEKLHRLNRSEVDGLATQNAFYPRATIKCDGLATFRCQAARDLACLFDVDTSIASWSCRPRSIATEDPDFDFLVTDYLGVRTLVDAPDLTRRRDVVNIRRTAIAAGCRYRGYEVDEVYSGFRLKNARDLLRYGNFEVGLNDRVRLLAALEENGSLTVAECLGAFQEIKPMAGLASLILREFVEVELDDELIGPQTAVRRIAG